MATNVVKVSGMFGNGKTYFADSPVVIDISGLAWPESSPFNIVRVKISQSSDESAVGQSLESLFPNSNAPFYTAELGCIDGAEIRRMADYTGVVHNVLVVTGYSKGRTYSWKEDLVFNALNDETTEMMMRFDAKNFQRIVELDSSQERCETLIRLCRVVYGFVNVDNDDFHADTGGQSSISFDVSSALRALWGEERFNNEVRAAQRAVDTTAAEAQSVSRAMRKYSLEIFTEYLSSDDGGVFTTTQCVDEGGNTVIPGGQCLIGGLTEWERYTIGKKENADVSALEHTGVRNGDASTKPTSSPERVGKDSITSWVDVQQGYTKSIFYPASASMEADDVLNRTEGWGGHAPMVLRDSVPYTDFLFVNRRGAVETCSGRMLEDMSIEVETTQYSRVERPTFKPSRSLMAIASGGRRSWSMSSGLVTREWAEWWTLEFLMARQWWMLYEGQYVPVVVSPAKKSVGIYDRTKQQMPHVDFTVTLALEG